MMGLNYIIGDITSVTEGVVLQGVNCQGAYGAGLSGAIKRKWPIAFDVFIKTPPELRHLGHINNVKINDSLWVLNCYTQRYYGNDGKRYASLSAIRETVSEAFKFAIDANLNVHMPKIGCGLGGLSWQAEVRPILEELQLKYNVYVNIWDLT